MAVTRIYTAGLQAVSNQVILPTGVPTTEGSARPCKLTSIIVRLNKSQSATRYIKLFDAALSTDVNADHLTGLTMALPIHTVAVGGVTTQKFVFPGGLDFALGLQICIDTTISGNTAAATTTVPEEVLLFWTEK